MVRPEVTTHQMRGARADAPLRSDLLQRGNQLRMARQTEVIVTAESEVFLPVYDDVRRLRALQCTPTAQQTLRSTDLKVGL